MMEFIMNQIYVLKPLQGKKLMKMAVALRFYGLVQKLFLLKKTWLTGQNPRIKISLLTITFLQGKIIGVI